MVGEMKYILCGAGDYGKKLLNLLGKDNVLCFADKASDIIKECCGLSVVPYKDLESIVRSNVGIVICTVIPENVAEIVLELNKMDLPYIHAKELAEDIVRDEAEIYQKMNPRTSFRYEKQYESLFPFDRMNEAGGLGGYFWQDLWAARKVNKVMPKVHYDIGSRIDGMIAHLLTYGQKVRLIDIRPLKSEIPGLEFIQADATNLDMIKDGTLESISAMCSIEHFGLGRYGDPIDPEACFKVMSAVEKKLATCGNFYFSVPIGKEHLEFNGMRVFYASTIIDSLPELRLVELSSYKDGRIQENIEVHLFDEAKKGEHGIGLFHFVK